MEELGQKLWLPSLPHGGKLGIEERLRIIDGRDRAQLFVDGQWIATQYQTEIGEHLLSRQPRRLFRD